MEVWSLRFKGCRNIYPLAQGRARKGFTVPFLPILEMVLDSIKRAKLKLRYVIADLPQMAKFRMQHSHSGCYGCPFCMAKSTSVAKKPKRNQKGGFPKGAATTKRVWGMSTLNQPLRTVEAILKVYENYRGIDPRDNEGQKLPESPLLRLPNFDMHSQVYAIIAGPAYQ